MLPSSSIEHVLIRSSSKPCVVLHNTTDWNAHCGSHIQFLAGVMLSFGGLLSELIQGGSPGLTASNPGLVKVMGGFVFPVGLVMYVISYPLCCVLTACTGYHAPAPPRNTRAARCGAAAYRRCENQNIDNCDLCHGWNILFAAFTKLLCTNKQTNEIWILLTIVSPTVFAPKLASAGPNLLMRQKGCS